MEHHGRVAGQDLEARGLARAVWRLRHPRGGQTDPDDAAPAGARLVGDDAQNRSQHNSQTTAEDQPGQAFPSGEIYLSFPGLGHRLAAKIAGEIGEHIEQFTTPNSLQCYAGRAPVTRRSGKRDLVVAHRLACNRYLSGCLSSSRLRAR